MVIVTRKSRMVGSMLMAALVMLGMMCSQNRLLHRIEKSSSAIELLPTDIQKAQLQSPTEISTTEVSHSSDEMQFAICTRVRNEAPYLREWIEYHRMIGFTKFIIMNDDSTDDTQCLLDAYSQEGIVQRVPQDVNDETYGRGDVILETISSKNDRIFDICAHYLASHEHSRNTWMLTSDVDEFLHVEKNDTLANAVEKLVQSRSPPGKSMVIPRARFGSSYHSNYEPNSLVVERFQKRYEKSSCRLLRRQSKRKDILVNKHQPHLFYCRRKGGGTFENGKAMSHVPSLATKCFELVDGNRKPAICQGNHRHTLLVNSTVAIVEEEGQRSFQNMSSFRHNNIDQDGRYFFATRDNVETSLVLFHYGTKSKREFYDRVCESVWNCKYFNCPNNCTPETFFTGSEPYLNNHEDHRMAPLIAPLKARMEEASKTIGATCNERPVEHSQEYYAECFERGRKNGRCSYK